jgi:teichuronic acid exporter
MNLKSQAISGFKWSIIDNFLKYFLTFFISIILARLLSPSDYGLIGMSTIFIAFSRVFVDGGFSDALIRKLNCNVYDYSSVLLFNIIVSVFLYFVLFCTATLISEFFNQPELILIIRVSAIGLLIGAFSSIHSTYLKKTINFKSQTRIGFFATVISGVVAIILAIYGYSYWSLIISNLIQSFISTILLWINNKDLKLKFIFKVSIIKEHFSFGFKVMLGSLAHMIYNNMYYALIGKFFNVSVLGFYTRADNFQKLFSENIDIIVRQVTYPVLSQIQNDENELKSTYQTMIRSSALITFFVLGSLFVISESFVLILLGGKWLPTVPYLRILCFVGMFMPLISINTNVLNVKGRSDLSLKIIIIKIVLSIPSLYLGYFFGIFAMIFGILISLFITYFYVISYTSKLINYSFKEQLLDILPAIKILLLTLLPVYFIDFILPFNRIINLFFELILILLLFCGFATFFDNKEFNIIKSLIFSQIRKKRDD